MVGTAPPEVVSRMIDFTTTKDDRIVATVDGERVAVIERLPPIGFHRIRDWRGRLLRVTVDEAAARREVEALFG